MSGRCWRKLALAGCVVVSALFGAGAESLQVFRTMMPDAGPSAFAVGLPGEIGFCYDPGRGGINYAWRGAFVDLAPTWKAKINEPAIVRGRIGYREAVRWPLRFNGASGDPRYEFRGYLLLADGVEFHYLLDGILVREEIRPADGGRALVRRFQLSETCSAWRLAVEAQPECRVTSPEAHWSELRDALMGTTAREFTVKIELRAAAR
jgi:hypothetical protein